MSNVHGRDRHHWHRLLPHSLTLFIALFSSGLLPGCSLYPDLQVVAISSDVINTRNQYEGKLKITGFIRNQGLFVSDFKHNGDAILSRGNQVVKKIPFGPIKGGTGVNVTHDATESCYSGASTAPLYTVRIEYDPNINAPKKQIDWHFGNNELSVTGKEICNKISVHYVSTFRPGLLNALNQYRSSKGKSALTLDQCLTKAAQGHSDWLHSTGTPLSHTGKNASGPSDRCKAAGCTYGCAEILNECVTPKNCVYDWKISPTHDNIMLGNHTKIGIGVAYGTVTVVFQ